MPPTTDISPVQSTAANQAGQSLSSALSGLVTYPVDVSHIHAPGIGSGSKSSTHHPSLTPKKTPTRKIKPVESLRTYTQQSTSRSTYTNETYSSYNSYSGNNYGYSYSSYWYTGYSYSTFSYSVNNQEVDYQQKRGNVTMS
jgi:hypothetical protein